jgi:hypothetical protein
VVAGGRGCGKVNINDNMDVSSCSGALESAIRIGSGNAGLHVGFHDGGYINTLSDGCVSTGYEYALTNGNDYTISSSSNFLQLHTMLITRIMLISTTQPVNGYPVLVYDSTLGTYTGSYSTIVDEVIISGEWTQVMMPYPLRITSANLLTIKEFLWFHTRFRVGRFERRLYLD